MAVPLSPEEQARVASYWGATPANSSIPGVTPPEPAPAPFVPHADAIDLDAPVSPLSQGIVPGAITYGENAKIPGAIEYGTPAGPPAPKPLSPETQAFKTGAMISADVPEMRAAPQTMKEVTVTGSPSRPMPSARGPANPDPWGIRAAQKGLVGTYDAREDAAQRLMHAEADKAAVVGDHHAELARRRSEDASINQMEQQYTAEHFEEKMVELERQLDDVASKKIDPKRLMKEEPALGFLAVIGGAIGGFYQGLTRSGENPFLKELNVIIDRDIAAQEKEIDSAQRNAGAKMSLLAQQRAVFQDSQQAKLAAQALYYQAAEDELVAEAARYDQPIYQARADEAIQAIRAEKQSLLLKIGEQQRAQSAAAAGQAFQREKEVQALYRDVYDKVLATTKNPMMAEEEAKRQVTAIYRPELLRPRQAPAGGVDPIGLVPEKQQEEAMKERSRYVGAQRAKAALDKVWADYEAGPDLPTVTGLGNLDTIKDGGLLQIRQALGEGFSSDKDTIKYVESNLPTWGEPTARRQQKLANIKAFIDAKSATPTLDQHAPGWRPKDIARKDVK